MRVSLDEWVKFGWLRPHVPTSEEIQELLAVVDRDLKDASSTELSVDWKFGIAYNAGLQLARICLLASGYETLKGDSHHFRAIDSLQFTLQADAELVTLFQTFRKKRSQGVYETVGVISQTDAAEMLASARSLKVRTKEFLKNLHPTLLKKT
jgi:hypothetical protein